MKNTVVSPPPKLGNFPVRIRAAAQAYDLEPHLTRRNTFVIPWHAQYSRCSGVFGTGLILLESTHTPFRSAWLVGVDRQDGAPIILPLKRGAATAFRQGGEATLRARMKPRIITKLEEHAPRALQQGALYAVQVAETWEDIPITVAILTRNERFTPKDYRRYRLFDTPHTLQGRAVTIRGPQVFSWDLDYDCVLASGVVSAPGRRQLALEGVYALAISPLVIV